MRRSFSWLLVLAGVFIIVAAGLPIVEGGGQMVFVEGTVPRSLGGIGDQVSWLLLGAGIAILAGAGLLRSGRRRTGGVLSVLGALIGLAVGVAAFVAPSDLYAVAGGMQAGVEPSQIETVLEDFGKVIERGVGAILATVGGGMALIASIVLLGRRTDEQEPGDVATSTESGSTESPPGAPTQPEGVTPQPSQPSEPTTEDESVELGESWRG
jgi:hypothetical protein